MVREARMLDDAAQALSRVRGQSIDSEFIQAELSELLANFEYEMTTMQGGWADCIKGGWKPSGNLRRITIGIAMQMMQQWSKCRSVHPKESQLIFSSRC